MITFPPYPILVTVKELGDAYVIYVKENGMHQDDELCVSLLAGGQWRHVLVSDVKSWHNATYGIQKAPPEKERP
jgi:hypothetical protein